MYGSDWELYWLLSATNDMLWIMYSTLLSDHVLHPRYVELEAFRDGVLGSPERETLQAKPFLHILW